MISRRRLATSIALAIVVSSALLVRLDHPELHTDEITYMSSVLESMVQGTVLPVQGDGELFINKPPLALWLMRLSFEVLGPSPFAARLPSVLATAATVVVLYLFGAAVFGEAAGVLAALIFTFTPGLLLLHGIRSATPDALEILLVTVAIVCLELWRRRRQPWTFACMVAAVAASAWVKSPFSLAGFVAYLLATELPARRAGRGTPRFVATVALVAGVWMLAYLLWLATLSSVIPPEMVAKRLLLGQYVRRIEGRLSAAHVQGPGYYLATTARDFGPLLLLPIGAVVAAVVAGLAARRGPKPSGHDMACLLAWALAAPLLATASASKLAWYTYLSYPGIALLLAVSARRLARSVSERTSVQVALLASIVLWLGWRLPAGRVWPAEARFRGVTGRLWEVVRHDSRIAVVPGTGFRLPRQRGDAYRETRLFLRALLWESRASKEPTSCRVTLVNRRRGITELGDVLELYPQNPRGLGLFLVDGCGGLLRGQLTRDSRE